MKLYYFTVDYDTSTSPASIRRFLDMLRYDQAVVCAIENGYIILSTKGEPTVERWNSFFLYTWNHSRDLYATKDLLHAALNQELIRIHEEAE